MLLGVAPIKLEEADLFGETTREKIQDNYSDLSKVWMSSVCTHVHMYVLVV